MTTAAPFRPGRMAFSAYLPALLFCIGEGAVIPLIPVIAQEQGASLGTAALVAGMLMVGQLVGDLPAGGVVRRLGEREAMILAAFVALIGLAIAALAPNPLILALGILIVGTATSVFALARHAYLTVAVPLKYRARALSTLGGIFRAGYFIGPLISAGLLATTNSNSVVFLVHAACCVLAIVVLLVARLPQDHVDQSDPSSPQDDGVKTPGVFATVIAHRGVLARVGVAASLIGGLRASRTVILPLVALSIGMPDPQVALVIGIANGIDFALFFASGWIMDRFGRLWAAVPSMIGLGLGHIALALTYNIETFIAVAIALALANGLGSGILNTLGSDVAPSKEPAIFLGAWRLTGDTGQAAGPLLVSAIAAAASVATAGIGLGIIGLIGAGLLLRYVPRYVPRQKFS